MGFLLLIPLQIHPEVTWGLSQPHTQAEVEEWAPGRGCAHPKARGLSGCLGIKHKSSRRRAKLIKMPRAAVAVWAMR